MILLSAIWKGAIGAYLLGICVHVVRGTLSMEGLIPGVTAITIAIGIAAVLALEIAKIVYIAWKATRAFVPHLLEGEQLLGWKTAFEVWDLCGEAAEKRTNQPYAHHFSRFRSKTEPMHMEWVIPLVVHSVLRKTDSQMRLVSYLSNEGSKQRRLEYRQSVPPVVRALLGLTGCERCGRRYLGDTECDVDRAPRSSASVVCGPLPHRPWPRIRKAARRHLELLSAVDSDKSPSPRKPREGRAALLRRYSAGSSP